MADVSCPNCGNPQLDVDAQNSVVYCRQCGFAVRVDPQTGEAVPISQGNAPGGAGAQGAPAAAPAVYQQSSFFGLDSTTFLLAGTIAVLIVYYLFLQQGDGGFFFALILWVVFFFYWLKNK
ncbi:MAG: hypothetical protein AABW54_02790 [Candidatus Micrarchaeota archaeon]